MAGNPNWLSQTTENAARAGIAQGARRGFDFPQHGTPPWTDEQRGTLPWTDAQRWARQHTPPGTLFYAPDSSGFSALSRRPVWWDARQGAAAMWNPSFFKEWNARRIKAESTRDFAGLVDLARNERISFLVVQRHLLSAGSSEGVVPRYCNEKFCVLEVTVEQVRDPHPDGSDPSG